MEHKQQFEHTLIRYILKQTSEKENITVLDWISADSENLVYYENLRNILSLIAVKKDTDSINLDFEWNRFRKSLEKAGPAPIVPIQPTVEENEFDMPDKPGFRFRKRSIMRAVMVAASLIVVMGLLFLYNQQNISDDGSLSKAGSPKDNASVLVTRKNNTGKPLEIKLQDGSEIILFDKAELQYKEPFTDIKRDIKILSGEASFIVARDVTRPFTVYSGDISTTALGTKFSVTNIARTENIVVRLFEGKVVIKSNYSALEKLDRDFYLLPGNALVYDRFNYTATLVKFDTSTLALITQNDNNSKSGTNKNDRAGAATEEQPSIPKRAGGSWYMFNNQSLGHVFEQLGKMYKVEIVYNKADVSKLYFIGEFNKSDSIDAILEQITSLNNLKLFKQDQKFIITK